MREWLPLKGQYLHRLYHQESGPAPVKRCSVSGCDNTIQWRCLHCIGRPLLCTVCCRNLHGPTPFHRIQKWVSNTFFSPAWLHEVGVVIRLGHNGRSCMEMEGQVPPTLSNSQEADGHERDSDWESDNEEDVTVEREDWMYGRKGECARMPSTRRMFALTHHTRY